MTVTDELVRFIGTAAPPPAALAEAGNQLREIRRLVRISGDAVKDAYPAGPPTATNRAWRTAITAAGADGWPAVGAAVVALHRGSTTATADAQAATAIGTAVADQLRTALRSTTSAERWSHRSVASVLGAGAGAGRLLRLDEAQLRHLLGLCATQAAGLADADETGTGTLQLAKAAADAVEAAVLARHGFTSSVDGLGGRRGLFEVLAPGAVWPPGLGDRWGTDGD
ncbi:MmgE/PrpD family protein [Mycobacterium sp. NPDC003449]